MKNKKPSGYWQSKTICRKVAKKCKCKSEMQKRFSGAYINTIKRGWIDEFFPESKTKRGKVFWTKNTCREEAKKYTNITDFSKKSSRAYRVSLDNGWLDEFGFKERKKMCYEKKIWTKEECAEIASQCRTRNEFLAKKASAYRFAASQGWLDDLMGITNQGIKHNCQKIASHYKRSSQLKKFAPATYKKCLLKGWLDEFYPHEIKPVDDISKNKTIRSRILDYVENNGPQTKEEIKKIVLTIAGQNINRKEWGVSYWDNVSYGNSVFIPTKKDKRYLIPVRGFNSKVLKYDIAKTNNEI